MSNRSNYEGSAIAMMTFLAVLRTRAKYPYHASIFVSTSPATSVSR